MRILWKIVQALLAIVGIVACVAIIYVIVASGRALSDAWHQLFGRVSFDAPSGSTWMKISHIV